MGIIKELWHENIAPQDDARNNTKEMKELMGYMTNHHVELIKSMTDKQKEIFEKFDDCWSEYMSLVEAGIFEYAFKLGMQIAIETLSKKIRFGVIENPKYPLPKNEKLLILGSKCDIITMRGDFYETN